MQVVRICVYMQVEEVALKAMIKRELARQQQQAQPVQQTTGTEEQQQSDGGADGELEAGLDTQKYI